MTDPTKALTALANVIFLLRDKPDAVEVQKAAFKAFAQELGASDLSLTLTPTGFRAGKQEVAFGPVPVDALHAHLAAHGIGGVRIPGGLMSSTLLALVRALAARPGSYGSFDHLVATLDAAGTGSVQVVPLDPLTLKQAQKVRQEPHQAEEGALDELGPDAISESQVGMMHFATLELHSITPLDEQVNRLESQQNPSAASELLNELIASAEVAARHAEWVVLLRAVHSLIELETKVGDTGENRGYGIALKRMLPRSALERIARFVTNGQHRTEAVAVLRRMGADATEVLLHELVTSEDAGDRRAYFNALKEMTEGGELLIHMLSHDDWFVVRNVADLAGELHMERAVPRLVKQLDHPDERVRRSVAGALAKIGGNAAAEALRKALKDRAQSVRLQAAASLEGRKAQGLAMSLAVAAETESKADVRREMYLALGRIASRDAVNALAKAAAPVKGLFKRRALGTRLAAIEGLHAAGPSAANALKELLQDEEPEVKEAAQKALTTIWEG
jgi:HEAT repeat protein